MACRLFGDNPLSEPMMVYCLLILNEHICLKFISFHSRNCIWKFRPQKWRPSCLSLNMSRPHWGWVATCVSEHHTYEYEYRIFIYSMCKPKYMVLTTMHLKLLHAKRWPFCHGHHWVNSLWPSKAIWRHRTGSTLTNVMACCQMAPSHYLKQC